ISGSFNVTGDTTLSTGASVTFSPGAYIMNNLFQSNDSSGAYTSKLDITSSSLIFKTSSTSDAQAKLSNLKAVILAGFANSSTGITSSTAQNDPAHYTIALLDDAVAHLPSINHQSLDFTDLILSLAHLGDANNNGTVDIQDLTLIANNWQKPSTNW